MTALYFETEDQQQLDTAIFDGYPVGDRLLEGVLFIVKIVEGKLDVTIHPDYEDYFSKLNTEYWLKKLLIIFKIVIFLPIQKIWKMFFL